MHRPLYIVSPLVVLRAAHEERSARQRDEHDARLPVAVLGVSLGVRAEALYCEEESNVIAAQPDQRAGDDDHGEDGDDSDPAALARSPSLSLLVGAAFVRDHRVLFHPIQPECTQ